MRAVILAGGKGTRLAPYSTVLPKPLMPIDDMPILEIVVRQLKHFGFRHITIAVGHLAELLESFFGNGRKFGVRIDYSREDKPLGTAGPLSLIRNLREPFLVMNGDLLTTLDFAAFMRAHKQSRGIATLAVYPRPVKIDLGIIKATPGGLIKEYIEKPTLNYNVSSGIYAFNPAVREYIPRNRRFDLPVLIRDLIRRNLPVRAYEFRGYWLDIGRPDDYAQAVAEFSKHRARFLRN